MSTTTPQLNDRISDLTNSDIAVFRHWCQTRNEKFPVATAWLSEVIQAEESRRNNQVREHLDLRLPAWNGSQLSDCLQAFYTLSEQPLTPSMADFADDVFRMVVCDASAVLDWQHEQLTRKVS